MGDWGKRIRLVFADDGGGAELFSVNSAELISKFRIKETDFNSYIYPTSVTIGDAPNVLYLDFADFNQVQLPCTIEYLGGASLRGKDIPVDAFNISASIDWQKLNRRGGYEYLEVSSVVVAGEIKGIEFLSAYNGNEYLEVTSVTVTGLNQLITFEKGYAANEYLEVTSVVVSGTYADVNGVPV